MNFKKVSEHTAIYFANDNNEIYTSSYSNDLDQYYIFKELYTTTDLPNIVSLSNLQMDGLTPINPNKPMFPKK